MNDELSFVGLSRVTATRQYVSYVVDHDIYDTIITH